VSFHSLEDRLVKDFLKDGSGLAARPSRHLPVVATRKRLLARFGLGSELGSSIEVLIPSALAAIEERSHWQRFGL